MQGNCVRWNEFSVAFLDKAAQKAMVAHISKQRHIPVEFKRFNKEFKAPAGKKGKGAGAGEEVLVPGYHGVSYVDISSLMYPGATQLNCAFPVLPYDEAEMTETTGWTREALDEVLYPAKKHDKKPPPKKGDAAGGHVDEKATEESAVYKESGTYVCLSVVLSRPLVPKRSAESFNKSVNELIPTRDLYPKHCQSADSAVNELHTQITSVAQLLLDQYRDVSKGGSGVVESRQELFYNLNTSGKYFAYKEQIKRAVVKVVREKFGKTATLSDPKEREEFLTKLYTYLIKEMHKTLNDSFTFSTADLVAPVTIGVDHIRNFAVEAEGRDMPDLAAKYHQELIARRTTDVEGSGVPPRAGFHPREGGGGLPAGPGSWGFLPGRGGRRRQGRAGRAGGRGRGAERGGGGHGGAKTNDSQVAREPWPPLDARTRSVA